MMLLIDNYDSFTYNLAHLFGALGVDVTVLRNDELDADEAERLAPSHLVVSPGPGRPADAGASIEIIRRLARQTPTLGEVHYVCPIDRESGDVVINATAHKHYPGFSAILSRQLPCLT